IVEEARTIMLPRAQAKDLRLEAHVGANVPAMVRTDPLRLRQVLINFAGNACKFTSQGGVFLHVTREAEREGDGRAWLRLEVVDTGPGFDPQRAAALFEAYVQEDASTTRRYGGTGLGLAISKRIVEMLGGAIGCSTEPGWGSTFWCTVPVPVVAGAQEAAVYNLPDVLLVGAPGDVQENLTAWLGQQDAKVTCAADAQEAERIAAERGPFPHIVQWGAGLAAADSAKVKEGGASSVPAGTGPLAALPGSQLIVLGDGVEAGPALVRYRAYRYGAHLVLRYPQQLEDLRQALAAAKQSAVEVGAESHRHPPLCVPHDLPPVLIIDDAATNRVLAQRQLARLGFPCDSAENGLEGLKKATAGTYSLILVDSSMPVM
ncbi:MAG TPA: ATP-binding protein, partial [bacterium]|nr:ATP-binding protein [bacterium]